MARLTLILGPKNYSSWSMRAWLLLRWLQLPFDEVTIPLYGEHSREWLLRYSPTAKVPVLIDDGVTIWDTLAIIMHLADAHPHIWPADPAKRAYARGICAEMHAGFQHLRNIMSYNARGRDRQVEMTPDLVADIARIREIWTEGRRRFGAGGAWLLGEFGVADIMFAPPAIRFVTYGVALDGVAESYSRRLLGHPLVREWLTLGQADAVIPACELGGTGIA